MLRVNRSNSDTDEDRDSDERDHRKSIRGRRRSSSDPVNLSLGRQDDSDDTHIDVETIGSGPNKVRTFFFFKCEKNTNYFVFAEESDSIKIIRSI